MVNKDLHNWRYLLRNPEECMGNSKSWAILEGLDALYAGKDIEETMELLAPFEGRMLSAISSEKRNISFLPAKIRKECYAEWIRNYSHYLVRKAEGRNV